MKHLRKAQSQYLFFGGAIGALYFRAADPLTFDPSEVIAFAGKNDWGIKNTFCLGKDDFGKFLDEKGHVVWLDLGDYIDRNEENRYERDKKKTDLLRHMTTVGGNGSLWIQDDCTVLSFDTGNRIGLPSYVVISADGSEMVVYCDDSR